MEDVVISVVGKQHLEGMDPSMISMVTDGTMKMEGETIYLQYPEPEGSGMEGTRTTIKVEPSHVTLTREGTTQSVMEFEKGKQNLALYDTGMGALTLGLKTRRLQSSLGPDGGHLEISYRIVIDEMIRGLNSFEVDVKKKEPVI